MSAKRKRHHAAFKAKVAVEAIRGLKSTAELAAEHQVHPSLITQWKRHALDNLSTLFEGPRPRAEVDAEAAAAPLYEKIGRLEVELEWVKKKAQRLG
jgi:transposase-like protein